MTVHQLSIQPRDWRDSALCAQTDPEVFHPDQGQSPQDAKRICAACPVRTECLTAALAVPAHQDRFGIYGGLSYRERRTIRRNAA